MDSLTIKASIAGDVSLRSGVGGASASGVDVSSLLSQLGGNLGSLAGAAGAASDLPRPVAAGEAIREATP